MQTPATNREIIAYLQEAVEPLIPSLAAALNVDLRFELARAFVNPYHLLAVDLEIALISIYGLDGELEPVETRMSTLVRHAFVEKSLPAPDKINQLAWDIFIDDHYWPVTVTLLQKAADEGMAEVARALMFRFACLVAHADAEIEAPEKRILRNIYRRLYGAKAQTPRLSDFTRPSQETESQLSRDVPEANQNATVSDGGEDESSHNTVEGLITFVRHNLDEFKPLVRKYPADFKDGSLRPFYLDGTSDPYLFADLLVAYVQIAHHGQFSTPEMAAWQALLNLAHFYGLAQAHIDTAVTNAEKDPLDGGTFLCFLPLGMYDLAEGTHHVAKYRTFLLDFALRVAELDGVSTPEEESKAQMAHRLDEFIAILPGYQSGFRRLNSDLHPKAAGSAVTPERPNDLPKVSGGVVTGSDDTVEACLAELEQLVGLTAVKANVTTMINFIRIQQKRQALGFAPIETTLHMVFKGNPGTGKTTVARLLARIYRAIGLLRTGQLVEVDRAELIGEYLGQTSPKVESVVQQSLGGVLFIDEAYSLTNSERNDPYGHEAVSTLLKLMEDHKGDLVVIVAGYPEEMDNFIKSNPGLESRFTEELIFEDYTPAELLAIFHLYCKKAQYNLSTEAEAALIRVFEHAYQTRSRTFGNARFARNLFDDTIRNHANRIAHNGPFSMNLLTTIEAVDIPSETTNA